MARNAQIKLSDVATSRVNNLNFMRFIAALMVIVSHCYAVVLGGDAGSYLLKLTGDRLSPGGVSVGVFFLFGGFLIARSCEHYPEAKKFFSARVLRLFPELLFVVILTAFVLGPILSTLSPAEYFTNPQTYKYLLNGALIMVHQLPGVFTNNPSGDVVNAALWTLPVEFICYVLCFISYKLTKFDKKKFLLLSVPVFVLAAVYYVKFSPLQLSVVRAVLLFFLGVLIWVLRDRITISPVLGLASIVLWFVMVFGGIDNLAMLTVFPIACFCLAYGMGNHFSKFGTKFELSYGIYLWAFPIQQALAQYFPAWHPYVNALVAALLATCGAFVNHFVVTAPLGRFLKGRRQKALEAQKSSEEQNNADKNKELSKGEKFIKQ